MTEWHKFEDGARGELRETHELLLVQCAKTEACYVLTEDMTGTQGIETIPSDDDGSLFYFEEEVLQESIELFVGRVNFTDVLVIPVTMKTYRVSSSELPEDEPGWIPPGQYRTTEEFHFEQTTRLSAWLET